MVYYTNDLGRWIRLQEDKNLGDVISHGDDAITQRCGLLTRFGAEGCQVRHVLSVEDIWHLCIELLKTGWLQATSVGIGLRYCS
jgi:hypothetical protein